jgi:SAM-dependent methyltransferase
MQPKPSHLSGEYAAWFKDELVVAAYPLRPPYPEEVLSVLRALVVDEPRVILDVGCGPGDLARRLAPHVDRLDAVDFSAGMIEQGRHLPGGDAPNLQWMHSAVEDASLNPPYALITAGDSLHWMVWDVVLPRFAAALTPNGVLAVVERHWEGPEPLLARLRDIFARYSPVRDFRPFDMFADLEQRRLFKKVGQRRCGPSPWSPTADEFVEARHSQRALSRTHMGPAEVAGSDAAMRDALNDLSQQGTIERREGRLQLSVEATVTWGLPLQPIEGHD